MFRWVAYSKDITNDNTWTPAIAFNTGTTIPSITTGYCFDFPYFVD